MNIAYSNFGRKVKTDSQPSIISPSPCCDSLGKADLDNRLRQEQTLNEQQRLKSIHFLERRFIL